MNTAKRPPGLRGRTAVACRQVLWAAKSISSQAEALRLQETGLKGRSGVLTQKEGLKNRHTHIHPE